jgi:outer membrane protein OmpA-like peptidoglycan-associated protein
VGVASKINQQSRDPRHPVEPAQGGRPAGHPVDPRKFTLVRSSSAGIQRRVLPTFRVPAAPPRVAVAGLAATAALLGLAGCMNGPAKADPAGAIVIAATATANEPAPALSSANVALLETAGESSTSAVAYVVNPATGQPAPLPLTPKRGDGQVEYGPRRSQLLAQNLSRIGSQIGNQAATGPFDLLTTMLDASRVTSPPATMLLLTSGVTTSGGFDLRQVGWAEPPASAAADLKQHGLLPDLSGWAVIFSGLGETVGRQPALPLPQQTTLASYWLAICHAAGAAACRVDDSPRPIRPSRSTVPVPVVPVPAVQSITGPHGQQQSIVPADLLFAFGSATLLPGASSYLAPIAARAGAGSFSVSITGQASPDGGTASYNLRLSALRAQAVQRRLIMLGLPARQITQVNGIGTAGQSCTVEGTLDESKCAQLRRVVITLSPTTAAS